MTLPPPSSGVAVVTGATSGIGAALARILAERGYSLLLVARDEQRLDAARKQLGELGVEVETRRCDLTDEAQRSTWLGELAERDVSIVCNNAGAGSFGTFAELDADRLHEQVVLDTVAVQDLCRTVLPGMVARGVGAVLLTGSLAGNQPVPGSASYAASKAFVNSLAESLSAEVEGTGVTVSLVTPGPVRTEFAERAGVCDVADRIPAAMWVDPDDVAEAGLRALERGRRRVIPGNAARLLAVARRLTPVAALGPVLDKVVRVEALG